jgi:DNA-binding transcriptional MerR regulator
VEQFRTLHSTAHFGIQVVVGSELFRSTKPKVLEARVTVRKTGQMRLEIDDTDEGFRAPTVAKIVGISYRQLDYWARTKLVEPSLRRAEGSGSMRLYGFADIVQLKVVKRLLDTGISLHKVRLAITEVRKQGDKLADVTLLSDGNTVYAVTSDAEVLDLLRKGQGVFALALDPVIEELRGEVASFPSESLNGETHRTPVETAPVVAAPRKRAVSKTG